MWKLKDKETRRRFEERVGELVDVNAPDLWESFKDGVLKACDEVCGRKRGRRDRGDAWWWNEEVKDAIARKKAAFKKMCKNKTDENQLAYKKTRNQAKKAVARAMKQQAEQELNDLFKTSSEVFKFVKSIKRDGKDIEGGRCMRGRDGRLGFSEEDRGKIWKDHMEEIMNVENEWDQITEVNLVEGPIERVTLEEMMTALCRMKAGKAAGPL